MWKNTREHLQLTRLLLKSLLSTTINRKAEGPFLSVFSPCRVSAAKLMVTGQGGRREPNKLSF